MASLEASQYQFSPCNQCKVPWETLGNETGCPSGVQVRRFTGFSLQACVLKVGASWGRGTCLMAYFVPSSRYLH